MKRIGVDCPHCQNSFVVDEIYAGKRGRCPQCRESLRVPPGAVPDPDPGVPKAVEDDQGYGLERSPAAGAIARSVAVSKAPNIEPRPTRTPAEILGAFRGEIDPVRPTMAYRAWILVVAAVMLLLPMIYLGLVALVGYGIYWHATHHATIFREVRSAKAAILLYAGPIAVGGIVLAFMLKPLFARPVRREKGRGKRSRPESGCSVYRADRSAA